MVILNDLSLSWHKKGQFIAVMLDLEKAFDSPLMISLKANNSALRGQVERRLNGYMYMSILSDCL